MNDSIATLQPAEAGLPLSAAQLKSRLAVIQSVMRDVMVNGVDYGVIPGTDKPTLYKPGAEKLCVTFRLAPDDPLIESVPELSGDIRYRVRVPVRASDGMIVAVGVGECSTGEEKYRWRRPVHPREFDVAPEDQKRQKFTRSGDIWDQVRVNPSDVANTVLKMAHKRAYVHAVIMATAAGAIFTQDIEDLPDGVQASDAPAKPPIQPPQRKAAAPPVAGAGLTARVKVTGFAPERTGTGAKGPWTKYGIKADNGKTYSTFKPEHHASAEEAMEVGLFVDLVYKDTQYGPELLGLTLIDRQAGEEA